MKDKKIFKYFIHSFFAVILTVMISACGGDQGIREPLLAPEPVPDVVTNNYQIIRGNYFLLKSSCPQDDSALQIAQEQEAIFMTGGFVFEPSDEYLVGFVDEVGLARFFGDENTNQANCTAQVEGPIMHGTCTYVEGMEVDSCRFVYGKQVDGLYTVVWNDCESNDISPLEIKQDDNEVTLIGGFDYLPPPQEDVYSGVIEKGRIVFNIDVLNPGVGINATDVSDQFNCEATVAGTLLSGRCRDLTVNPATICTFGYDNATRTAGVDLGDDSLFPSPSITPGPMPTDIDISGTYARVSNDCEDDEGNIQIVQDGVALGLYGGFDYQSVDPDVYAGTINSSSLFAFSVLGPTARAFCAADINFDAQGIAGFGGSCNVVDSNSNPVETCAFSYSR